MSEKGIFSLAEIARFLQTSPQAVSNWKSRDQVPHHIAAKIIVKNEDFSENPNKQYAIKPDIENNEFIGFTDILLKLAEQLKIIIIVPVITLFITFTYVNFIQTPKYISSATVLLPEKSSPSFGGLVGIASQFGVDVPTSTKADLSSPSLFPELIKSRAFAEKLLAKEFFSIKYEKKLPLIQILNYDLTDFNDQSHITMSLGLLEEIVDFIEEPNSAFSKILVEATEPMLAMDIASSALDVLEELNRYYKSQNVNEKINFISSRIDAVKNDLEYSEKKLKDFNEKNRQISSPSLQLVSDRLTREVEIQKGIYLTLKQQFELAKIEEVQEKSIVQILDKPQLPLGPSNKNLVLSSALSIFIGTILGIILAFLRSYLNNDNIDERRKIRRVKNFIRKKGKDIVSDYRISAIMSAMLTLSLPFYLNSTFNSLLTLEKLPLTRYAFTILYLTILIIFITSYFKLRSKRKINS